MADDVTRRPLQPIRIEDDGTAVYLDVEIYRPRDEGRLIVTDRGIRFVGPVLHDIPWSSVISRAGLAPTA